MLQKPKSLRSQIVLIFLVLALVMALFLSMLSAHSTIRAIEIHKSIVMNQLAQETQLLSGQDTVALGYHIADRWQDVPNNIQARFPEPNKQKNHLYSQFEEWIFFAPPKKIYHLYITDNQAGERRYVSYSRSSYGLSPIEIRDGKIHFDPILRIFLIGLGLAVIFAGLAFILLRTLATPVETLYQWANNLSMNNLHEPIPAFKYNELNALAEIVHSSVNSLGNTLKKEHDFLRYVSHELRTPISVLISNVSFLEMINPNPPAKEREIRERISRASLTMKGTTEVLLWLERDQAIPVQYEAVNLNEILYQIVSDLEYLLEHKSVDLNLNISQHTQYLPAEAVRILLTNLIRNAFQHTESGTILISQHKHSVTISNPLLVTNHKPPGQSETGFGLGLKLSSKLVERFGWTMSITEKDGLHVVEVSLKKGSNTSPSDR
jgi:signal transduction histidine kinase